MENRDRPRLESLTSSAVYALRLVQTAAEIAQAPAGDEPTALALLLRARRELGVDAAYYASCFGDDETKRSYRTLLAGDPVWESQYVQNRWYAHDPWLHYATRHVAPARSEDLLPMNEHERWVMEAAAHFGFASAVVIPVPAPPLRARTGALCLGSSRADFFHDGGYHTLRVLARMVAMELGDWLQRTIRDELIRSARLREDDLVLLRHEQQGHGSKVIGEDLSAESNAIDSRFHRLRKRLAVENRGDAVRKVEIHGLL